MYRFLWVCASGGIYVVTHITHKRYAFISCLSTCLIISSRRPNQTAYMLRFACIYAVHALRNLSPVLRLANKFASVDGH